MAWTNHALRFFGASLVLIACNGKATSSGHGGGASTSSSGASTSTGSGGSKKGFVVVINATGATGPSASAGFEKTAGDFGACFGSRLDIPLGTCVNFTCPTPKVTMETSAGNITLANGANTGTLMPGANGGYASQSLSTAFWQPGATVDITTSGAEVPAFQVSLPIPGNANMTSPAGGALTIDRSAGLTFTWTGSPSNSVAIAIDGPPGMPATSIVECMFDGSTGKGVVPASALSGFQAGEKGTIGASVFTTKTTNAGAWSVLATMESLIYVNANVTYQ